ncbi:hypothetical protein L484_021743 [Morus notabilis]|uniref:Uncharacterized protein n=1 Tax=Morus notabilis TaxID=981085 RepID=W9S704_9ROSA|nr:hypothetical protein L484_021743 [Morus notabilis]
MAVENKRRSCDSKGRGCHRQWGERSSHVEIVEGEGDRSVEAEEEIMLLLIGGKVASRSHAIAVMRNRHPLS